MAAVAIGSNALHGSSIKITSGSIAMVRAMHKRCCWPPESVVLQVVESVCHFVPNRSPLEALFDDGVQLIAWVDGEGARHTDVVVDGFREGFGRWKTIPMLFLNPTRSAPLSVMTTSPLVMVPSYLKWE